MGSGGAFLERADGPGGSNFGYAEVGPDGSLYSAPAASGESHYDSATLSPYYTAPVSMRNPFVASSRGPANANTNTVYYATPTPTAAAASLPDPLSLYSQPHKGPRVRPAGPESSQAIAGLPGATESEDSIDYGSGGFYAVPMADSSSSTDAPNVVYARASMLAGPVYSEASGAMGGYELAVSLNPQYVSPAAAAVVYDSPDVFGFGESAADQSGDIVTYDTPTLLDPAAAAAAARPE